MICIRSAKQLVNVNLIRQCSSIVLPNIVPSSLTPTEEIIKNGIGAIISPSFLLGNGWFTVNKNNKFVVMGKGCFVVSFLSLSVFRFYFDIYISIMARCLLTLYNHLQVRTQ